MAESRGTSVRGSGFFSSLHFLSFLVIIGCVILQIVARYFFNAPLSWTEELSLFAFCWFTFAGSAVSTSRKSHLEIDYFYRKWPSALQKTATRIIDGLILILGIFIAADALFAMTRQRGMHSIALRIPIWLYTLAIAAGFAGIAFFSFLHLRRSSRCR